MPLFNYLSTPYIILLGQIPLDRSQFLLNGLSFSLAGRCQQKFKLITISFKLILNPPLLHLKSALTIIQCDRIFNCIDWHHFDIRPSIISSQTGYVLNWVRQVCMQFVHNFMISISTLPSTMKPMFAFQRDHKQQHRNKKQKFKIILLNVLKYYYLSFVYLAFSYQICITFILNLCILTEQYINKLFRYQPCNGLLNNFGYLSPFQCQFLKMKQRNWSSVAIALLIFTICMFQVSPISTPPVWVSSPFFKAGAITFIFSSPTLTSATSTITYSSAMVSTSLKNPVLGITDINYLIVSGAMTILISVSSPTSTNFKFNVTVNINSCLSMLKLTYFALDSSFTPPFSMTLNTNGINLNGPNINKQTYINFTASTGVILNTSHQNVLLPFMHYIQLVTYDNTIDINFDFLLVNGSYYSVTVTSTSNMSLKYAGFSRLIFDKTAIEAMGNDYFDYGIISSTNNNFASFSTIIPPNIIPENLYYGMHSFTIMTGLSQLYYTSSYDITSGLIGYKPLGTYSYSKMKFSYMHHKTRKCPAGYPFYNISEVMCYDECGTRWYGNTVAMTCNQCPYTCYTCTNATSCATCSSTIDFRTLNGTQCSPISGYYDNGTNSTTATACTSPCATCRTTGTYCLSCVTGFYLQSSSCISCSSAIPSCLTCTNSSFCTLCNSGGSGASCTSCLQNQYIVGFNCYNCSSAIVNCLSCTSSSACTLCANTFTLVSATSCSCTSTQFLSNGLCQACSSAISYCTTCSSSTICTSCQSTFILSNSACSCSSNSYLDANSNSCIICTTKFSYCSSCTNTTCDSCFAGFLLTNSSCVCPSGQYAVSSSSTCASCSSAISNCISCISSTACTKCNAGYDLNIATLLCDLQPCQISNCYVCQGSNYSVCSICDTGFSLSKSNTSCQVVCGDGQLNLSFQQCDDGNYNSGDGCSLTCKIEAGFSCAPQYVNVTYTYSQCYYSGQITFSTVWIRKLEGQNTLKILFQLGQAIDEWRSVNFTTILSIDVVDPSTYISTGMVNEIISAYSVDYIPSLNRFSVVIDYKNYDLQQEYLSFTLDPYSSGTYPAFTPPSNVEFLPPLIQDYVVIIPNNNQNAKYYSDQIYSVYSLSVKITYAVLGFSTLIVISSLAFRTGKVIAFQMLTIIQISYFSMSFLDQMNPAFSALLPLRYLAGILNFNNVQDYLDQTTSPNSMKGIYMFLNLSQNFAFVAISFGLFLLLGVFFYLVYVVYDWSSNSSSLQQQSKKIKERNGYCMYRFAYHFVGQLSLSLIFACLPLYLMSLFFEVMYTVGSSNFWSYSIGTGIGLANFIYFIALIKQNYSSENQFDKLGEYMSQYSKNSVFQNFKYPNLQILLICAILGLSMITIYSENKLFATISIIFISFVEIVLISVLQPYKFGFVSCFKGQDNHTEGLFQKIQLFKVYDKQLQLAKCQAPDQTLKYEKEGEIDTANTVFTQHFSKSKKDIKSKHQGLIQDGKIVKSPRLFLFNNNFRRIINLLTLIVVEFVFACTAIFEQQINQNYDSMNIKVALPILIHCILFVNVIYNFCMMILQVMNRTKESRVLNQFDTGSQIMMNSMYSQKKDRSEEKHSTLLTNEQLIKQNASKSMYSTKRPQILHPINSRPNLRMQKRTQNQIQLN